MWAKHLLCVKCWAKITYIESYKEPCGSGSGIIPIFQITNRGLEDSVICPVTQLPKSCRAGLTAPGPRAGLSITAVWQCWSGISYSWNPYTGEGLGNRAEDVGQAIKPLKQQVGLFGNSWQSTHFLHKPHLSVPKQPDRDKNICRPHPCGLGPRVRHTWHCMSDCRRPRRQLSTAPSTASQRSLSWPTLPWSSRDSVLSGCRRSLLLTLTEPTKAL